MRGSSQNAPTLRDLLPAQQRELVRRIFQRDADAVRIFRSGTIQLLFRLAAKSPLARWHLYPPATLADLTLTYLVCGVRLHAGADPATAPTSPLQHWLLTTDTATVPLIPYLVTCARHFLQDVLRARLREHQHLQAYYRQTRQRADKRQKLRTEADSSAPARALIDLRSPLEEALLMSRLFKGWLRQLSEPEQAIIRYTAPICYNLSQMAAAQHLGLSNATLSRRLKSLRAKFHAYLQEA